MLLAGNALGISSPNCTETVRLFLPCTDSALEIYILVRLSKAKFSKNTCLSRDMFESKGMSIAFPIVD